MDTNRIRGVLRQATGSVKEVVGKAIGNKKMQAGGKAEQSAGKVDNLARKAKDAARRTGS